ncbi:MAG: glucosylceramidase [Treponema sp.]|nr:glucosylceramidase [Treponema sp.]
MKITRLYETAKDSSERISEILFADRAFKPTGWIPTTLTLKPSEEHQKFEGFGGALTESSGYVLSRLPSNIRQQAIEAYYNPHTGNGYRLARIHMNSCDFSLDNWACVPEKDETLTSFSMERTDKYISPLAMDVQKAAQNAGSSVQFLVSPWSPPVWMKDNGDMNHGGHLLPHYKDLWAQYFVKFIQKMAERDIKISFVTIQNEPAAVQTWDSCEYSASEEGEFAAKYLGPALEKAGLGHVKIYIWDHNRDLALERLEESLAVPGAEKYVAGLAFHWYSGDQYDNIKTIAQKYPQIDLMFTEGCIEGGPRDGAWFSGERYAHNIINDLKSGCTKWIDWNIVLDMQGGPNHVGNYCDAPILADEKTGSLHFQSSFYYIGHFSRFIQPGAVRLSSEFFSYMTPATVSGHLTDEAETLAFRNPDGTVVLIITNRTEADLAFELKVEFSKSEKNTNLISDWEKARTQGNSQESQEITASASAANNEPVYLKIPPRAIQTWILEDK